MSEIKRLIAVIGRKTYECVPAAGCDGCAFERKCFYANGRRRAYDYCPVIGDRELATNMGFIYKEVKNGRKGTTGLEKPQR